MSAHLYWPSKEGPVRIDEMSDSHILNTIWMLMRQAGDMVKIDGVNYVIRYPTKDPGSRFKFLSVASPNIRTLIFDAERRNLDWMCASRWQPPAFWLSTGDDVLLELPLDCPGIKRADKPGCLVSARRKDGRVRQDA